MASRRFATRPPVTTPAMAAPVKGSATAQSTDTVANRVDEGKLVVASVYNLAVERLGVAANRILFFSSNGWDAHGAAAFGFRVVWINRAGDPAEPLPGVLTATVGSIGEVPALLGLAA